MKIKNIDSLKKIVSRFPNYDSLEYFVEMHKEELVEFFRGKYAKVIWRDDKASCSECDYVFETDGNGESEEDYVYCSGCLKPLLCCDDEFCDHDEEVIDNEIKDTFKYFYNSTH